MATSTEAKQIYLEASNAKWGRSHCRTITCVANAADALDGLYLPINYFTPNLVEVKGYVWFDGAGAGTDPAPSGLTLIGAVAVTGGSETFYQVAAALKVTLDAAVVSGTIKAFKTTSVIGAVATVENNFMGAITAETDVDSTGCTFESLVVGFGTDLGPTEGGIELNMETKVVEIKTNQSGELIEDEIYVGSSGIVSMSLLEVTKARFDILVGKVTGDTLTPAGGTSLTGYGDSRLFQSLSSLGGQLVLHPIRLAETDYSYDVSIPQCAPKPSSLNFDGTAPQVMAIEFNAYRSRSTDSKINLWSKGDWTQDIEA